MFDLSFGKLALLFALCLIVLGPEKLPRLAQQLGRWTGQARAMARHFRSQLEQEIATGELQKQRKELEDAVKSSIDAASAPLTAMSQTVTDAQKSVMDEIDPGAANGSGHGDLSQPTPTGPTGDVDLDALVAGDFSNQNSHPAIQPTSHPSIHPSSPNTHPSIEVSPEANASDNPSSADPRHAEQETEPKVSHAAGAPPPPSNQVKQA
jgi:sec-independent protein translocase protein TatB